MPHTELELSNSELEREANIAKNRVLFEQLGIKDAITNLGTSSGKLSDRKEAKPVQPTKRERGSEPELPRRQSRRLLTKTETLTLEERAIREVYDMILLLPYFLFLI